MIKQKAPYLVDILGGCPRKPAVLLMFFVFGAALSAPHTWAAEITLTKDECQALIGTPVTHVPAAGVAYQPGMDAYGNPVAGADLAGAPSPIQMPDEISFDISTDLEEKYGIGTSGVFSGEGTIGKVTFRGGQAYWNDQPLDAGDSAAVVRACQATYGKP